MNPTSEDPDQSARFHFHEVGGVPFAATTFEGAVEFLLDSAIPNRLPINVRLANAYNVALADDDPSYSSILNDQGINLPDGSPIVWFLRRGGHATASRVRGPSFFEEVLMRSAGTNVRHFLLGASDKTLTQLTQTVLLKYPTIKIAGSYSPPYADVDEDFISLCEQHVLGTRPDVVWVGLGTPKQDYVGTDLAARLGVPTVNVGAAFDFLAGTAREAPVWVQKSGFEWLYRLAAEPRRLWRRYLWGNPRFLKVALRQHLCNRNRR